MIAFADIKSIKRTNKKLFMRQFSYAFSLYLILFPRNSKCLNLFFGD